MNVTVAEQDKLRRKIQVEIPLSEVEAAYDAVYAQLRANLRVPGFRPGKFPRHLAEKRFKSVMEGEAMQNLVPKYYDQALKELELRPATEPKFDNLEIDKKKPFKFDVEFEVMPEVKLLPPSKFKLSEKKAKITAKEIDERVEEMRQARASYKDKGNKPAGDGDAVTFDFEGLLDGVAFEGGSGENQRNEVGSGQYLAEFDAAFKGIKAGESKSFPLTFPKDYGAPELAGKEVAFTVTAKQVEEKVPAELNEEFFAPMGGAKDLKEFKEKVREQLEAEHKQEAMQAYQEELTEQLRTAYSFDVPETLVQENLHEFEHQLSHDDPESLKDEKKLAKLKKEEEEKILGNLRIAYVLDAIARENEIKVDEEEVRQRFFYQAYMLRQNPAELINEPIGRRLLMQIEQSMLTQRVMEHLADEVLAKGGKTDTPKAGAKAADSPEKSKPVAKAADKAEGKPKADKPKAAKPTAGASEKADKPKAGAKSSDKPKAAKPKAAKDKA